MNNRTVGVLAAIAAAILGFFLIFVLGLGGATATSATTGPTGTAISGSTSGDGSCDTMKGNNSYHNATGVKGNEFGVPPQNAHDPKVALTRFLTKLRDPATCKGDAVFAASVLETHRTGAITKDTAAKAQSMAAGWVNNPAAWNADLTSYLATVDVNNVKVVQSSSGYTTYDMVDHASLPKLDVERASPVGFTLVIPHTDGSAADEERIDCDDQPVILDTPASPSVPSTGPTTPQPTAPPCTSNCGGNTTPPPCNCTSTTAPPPHSTTPPCNCHTTTPPPPTTPPSHSTTPPPPCEPGYGPYPACNQKIGNSAPPPPTTAPGTNPPPADPSSSGSACYDAKGNPAPC